MKGYRSQVVMMLPTLNAVVVRLGWSVTDYPLDDRVARIVSTIQRQQTSGAVLH